MKVDKWNTSNRVYIFALIVMAFTGFGQMPLYNRYYLSAVPGMGWTSDYALTHFIHYVGAMFLLALFAYKTFEYSVSGRKECRPTGAAYARIALLSGIVATGILRVIKNLPDVSFSPGFTLFFDIAHLGFVMAYLACALVFYISGAGWMTRLSLRPARSLKGKPMS
jgi:uncharacterized membrane protein (UPF0182 family)